MLEICLYFPGDEKRWRKSRESKLRCNHPQLEKKHGERDERTMKVPAAEGRWKGSEREVLMVFPIYWAHIFHHDSWDAEVRWLEASFRFARHIPKENSLRVVDTMLKFEERISKAGAQRRRLLRRFVNKIKRNPSRAITEGRRVDDLRLISGEMCPLNLPATFHHSSTLNGWEEEKFVFPANSDGKIKTE